MKREHNGFGKLYVGLENVAGLFLRADAREWLAVVPASHYFDLLKRAGA